MWLARAARPLLCAVAWAREAIQLASRGGTSASSSPWISSQCGKSSHAARHETGLVVGACADFGGRIGGGFELEAARVAARVLGGMPRPSEVVGLARSALPRDKDPTAETSHPDDEHTTNHGCTEHRLLGEFGISPGPCLVRFIRTLAGLLVVMPKT